jgi:hypothetical protein
MEGGLEPDLQLQYRHDLVGTDKYKTLTQSVVGKSCWAKLFERQSTWVNCSLVWYVSQRNKLTCLDVYMRQAAGRTSFLIAILPHRSTGPGFIPSFNSISHYSISHVLAKLHTP